MYTALSIPALAYDMKAHHNDSRPTGWNQFEKELNVAIGRGAPFGQQKLVTLDDRMDAQPLVVTDQPIAGKDVHDVVCVATEGNTVYAIDAETSVTLRSTNLGPPVPREALPDTCKSSGVRNGITSTPVLSKSFNMLWMMAYH